MVLILSNLEPMDTGGNINYSLLPWYDDNDILTVVNQCMALIERIGLSAERAGCVPECLAEAIQRSNQVALSNAKFKAAHFRVEIRDGAYEVAWDERLPSKEGE